MRTHDGPRILEVNFNPFLATTEKVCGVDIAREVALALIDRAAQASASSQG